MGKYNENEGKKFEQDFKDSCKLENILSIRQNDTSLSWLHEKTARFTPRNVADFLVFRMPYLFPVENKSTNSKRMSIQTDPDESDKKMIKLSQIQSLSYVDMHEGVMAGFLMNFRNDGDIRDNRTYWMPIGRFCDFLVKTGKKSITEEDCKLYGALPIEGKLRRTRYVYNVSKMLNDIEEDYKKYEEERKERITNGWSIQQEFFSGEVGESEPSE